MVVENIELTTSQSAILHSEFIALQGAPFYLGVSVKIGGCVALERLSNTVKEAADKIDVFRLGFVDAENEGHWQGVFYPTSQAPIEQVDFSDFPEPQVAVERWIKKQLASRDPLSEYVVRVFAVKYDETCTGWFIKAHHAAIDGAGLTNLVNQLISILADAPPNLDVPGFRTTLDAETSYLASKRFARDQAFWRKAFSGEHNERITASRPIGDYRKQSPLSSRYQARLDPQMRDALRMFKQQGGSVFRLLFASVALAQMSLEDADGAVLQMPMLNRWSKQEKQTVSMAVAPLMLKVTRQSEASLLDYYDLLKKPMQQALVHARFSPAVRWQEIAPANLAHLAPAFGVSYQTGEFAAEVDGMPIQIEHFQHVEPLLATFHIHDRFDSGDVRVEADFRGVWTPQQCQAFIDHVVAQACCAISPKPEYMPLLAKPQTEINQLLQQAILRHGDKVFIRSNTPADNAISYKQAWLWIQHFHHRLMNKWRSFTEDGPILLLGRRDQAVLLAYYACLVGNITVIPICPVTQSQRIEKIVRRSGTKMAICVEQDQSLLEGLGVQTMTVCADVSAVASSSCDDVSVDINVFQEAINPAYILYTSGSTGEPKGVIISPTALAGYIQSAHDTYGAQSVFNMPVFTPLGFDLTQTSLLLPALSGGSCQVFPDELAHQPEMIHSILSDKSINAIKCTPSHLAVMLDYANDAVSPVTFIVGGEGLETALVERTLNSFPEGTRVINEYGPSEATGGCCIQILDCNTYTLEYVRTKTLTPIGKPLGDAHLSIRDNWGQPLPDGFQGELWIAGPILSDGYYCNDEQTRSRFIAMPFTGETWYRSGDAAVFDGNQFHCLGRIDDEFKIRGNRIHPAEVETAVKEALSALGVNAAKIQIVAVKVELNQQALVVICSDEELCFDAAAMNSLLAEKLPAAMRPSHFCSFMQWPVTSNGKVDKQKLASLAQEHVSGLKATLQSAEDKLQFHLPAWVYKDCIEPLWPDQEVDLQRSFLSLGGDSIKAIRLVGWLAKANVQLAVTQLLSEDSLGKVLQQALEKHTESSVQTNEALTSESLTYLHWLPSVRWYKQSEFKYGDQIQQGIIVELDEQISTVTICNAVENVKCGHKIFSLRADTSLEKFAWDEIPQVAREHHLGVNETLEQRLESIKQEVCLEASPSVHEVIIGAKPGKIHLVWVCHHLLCDVHSWILLLDELHQQLVSPCIPKTQDIGIFQWAKYLAGLYSDLPSEMLESTGAVKSASISKSVCELSFNSALLETLQQHYKAERSEIIAAIVIQLLKNTVSATGEYDLIFEHPGRLFNELLSSEQQTSQMGRSVGWFTGFQYIPAPHALDYFSLLAELKSLRREGQGTAASLGVLLKGDSQRPSICINDIGKGLSPDMQQWSYFNAIHPASGGYRHADERPSADLDILIYDQHSSQKTMVELVLALPELEPGTLTSEFNQQLAALSSEMLAKSHQSWLVSDFPYSELCQKELEQIVNQEYS